MTTTLHDFRLASIAHLAAAKSASTTSTSPSPAKLPSSAAYLATVSLECVLKARILFRGGFESDETLRKKQPDIYRALFKGVSGHALLRLATALRLDALLRAEGKQMPKVDVWKRLSNSERPYSLRYGTEHLSAGDAADEIAAVEALHAPLLAGLNISKVSKGKRRKP